MDVQIERLRAQKEEEDEWLDETRALNAVLSQRVAELKSDVADAAGPARELEALEAESLAPSSSAMRCEQSQGTGYS